MTPDKVIVSVEIQGGGFCGDYELPANVPLKDFQRLLLEALVQHFPQNPAVRLCLEEGAVLCRKDGKNLREVIPEEDTLAAHGVWDGSSLAVLRKWH